MTSTEHKNTFILTPSWKLFFWEYLFSLLTIPVLGTGLVGLYFTRQKHKSMEYKISNTGIITTTPKYEHHVDLIDIKNIEIHEYPFQSFLGISTLLLQTSASNMLLRGLSNAREIKAILEQAIEAETKRQRQQQKTKRNQEQHKSGNLDKMEYLTGLWQQGLISEEDYKAERKHFE